MASKLMSCVLCQKLGLNNLCMLLTPTGLSAQHTRLYQTVNMQHGHVSKYKVIPEHS